MKQKMKLANNMSIFFKFPKSTRKTSKTATTTKILTTVTVIAITVMNPLKLLSPSK